MPKKTSADKPLSEGVAAFCDFVTSMSSEYRAAKAGLDEEDKLIQDYLHKLELEDCDYKERAKLGKLIAESRRRRRTYKNTIEVIAPFKDWMDGAEGLKINKLREVLGKMRKIEGNQETRTYYYRTYSQKDDNTSRTGKAAEERT